MITHDGAENVENCTAIVETAKFIRRYIFSYIEFKHTGLVKKLFVFLCNNVIGFNAVFFKQFSIMYDSRFT